MHYTEGTIEIFGLVLGVGFAVLMVVGATAMSRMLERDERQANARGPDSSQRSNVLTLPRRSGSEDGRRAA